MKKFSTLVSEFQKIHETESRYKAIINEKRAFTKEELFDLLETKFTKKTEKLNVLQKASLIHHYLQRFRMMEESHFAYEIRNMFKDKRAENKAQEFRKIFFELFNEDAESLSHEVRMLVMEYTKHLLFKLFVDAETELRNASDEERIDYILDDFEEKIKGKKK